MTRADDTEGATRAHRALLSRLDPADDAGLCDDDIGKPSRLAGWTVGHVLAHITLNAESFIRIFESSDRANPVRQYPGGTAQRNDQIERNAALGAREHILRLAGTIEKLEEVWSSTPAAWDTWAEMGSGAVVSVGDLPLRRWREVEVHMGDLGLSSLGCDGPECWSEAYVRRDVQVMSMQWTARGSMGLNSLPAAVARLEDRWRLAWLLGRYDIDGVTSAGLM